jgi:hypothetical protein
MDTDQKQAKKSTKSHSEKNNDKETKVKRPLNSYMLFTKERRAQVVKEYPELSVTEIAKHLGTEWKEMSIEDKQPFVDEAKRLKDLYEKQNPSLKKTKK